MNIELRQKPIRPFFFWGSGTLSLFLILLDMLYLYFSISRCFIYVGTINGFFYDDLFIFFQEQILTLEDKGQHFFFCSMPTCWNQPTDQCVFLALSGFEEDYVLLYRQGSSTIITKMKTIVGYIYND